MHQNLVESYFVMFIANWDENNNCLCGCHGFISPLIYNYIKYYLDEQQIKYWLF